MFISKLNLLTKPKTTQVDGEITLKPFVDLYFDTAGWYAFGHHDPTAFLAALVKQNSHTDFSVTQVQWVWAKFEGDDFRITELPIDGSQAITLVEDDGVQSFQPQYR